MGGDSECKHWAAPRRAIRQLGSELPHVSSRLAKGGAAPQRIENPLQLACAGDDDADAEDIQVEKQAERRQMLRR